LNNKQRYPYLLIFTALFFFLSYPTVIQAEEWVIRSDSPYSGGYGEAVVGTGDHIFIARCMYATTAPVFLCYSPSTDSWISMNTSGLPPGAFRSGTAMVWDQNDCIYVLLGGRYEDNNRRLFYRYSISNDMWEQLADTPHAQGAGDAIAWSKYDDHIYAMIGSNKQGTVFAQYSYNSWEVMTFNPNWTLTDDGASLVSIDENLYALQGEYHESIPNGEFARYHIPTAIWENKNPIPQSNGVGDGGSLLYIGDWMSEHANHIFAFGGGGSNEEPGYNFYQYNISSNNWIMLKSISCPIGFYVGNRLGYANNSIYYWQGSPTTEKWICGGDAFYMYTWSNETEPSDHVVINEIEQNPSGTDAGNEWIELYNPTTNDVNLNGWKVSTMHGVTVTVTLYGTIPAKGYFCYTHTKQWLDNEHESIILRDPLWNEIDRTLYLSDINNNYRSWQRDPNGIDTNSDADWKFLPSTKGYGSGGEMPPGPIVLKPNGEEEIPGGSVYDITWNVNAGTYGLTAYPIHVSYSEDDGATWNSIASNEPNDGRYSWNMPNIKSSDCLINLTARYINGNIGSDVSDSTFTILQTDNSTNRTISAGETATVEGPSESNTSIKVTALRDVTVTIAYYNETPHPGATEPEGMMLKYIDIAFSANDNVLWPVYVEMHYTDDGIAGMDESSLGLYCYEDNTWHKCNDTGVNITKKYVWANVSADECPGSAFGSGGSVSVEGPDITSFTPQSPVNDTIGNWRSFNVKANQTVNVNWYLNESLQFTNESVQEAGCMLHAGIVGVHNVSAIATNVNGTDIQEWVWNVTAADATPPASVSDLDEINNGTTWILWKWINPSDSDFNHTEVWIEGIFKENVSTQEHIYNATGLDHDTAYEITTRTVDDSGNINLTWVNDTATTLPTPDTNPPIITITSPINNTTYSTDSVDLNYSANKLTTWQWYSLDGAANITLNGNTTLTGFTDGLHISTVYANDTSGNMNSSMVWFAVDTTFPSINTVTLNTTTPNTGEYILVTVNATDNFEVTNVIVNDNALTYQGVNLWNGTITAIEGTHSVNVSVSDAAGNVGMNNSTTYTTMLPDITPPIITFTPPTDPDDTTLTTRNWTFINVSLSEPGFSWLEWNDINESMSGSGTHWYINKTGLDNDVYTYHVWANDCAGNVNVSETRAIEIDYVTDTLSPVITITSPVSGTTYNTDSIDLNYSVNEPTVWQGYSLDGTANITLQGNSTLIGLTDGEHTLTVYANDTSRNMNSSIVWFTIDTTVPIVNTVSLNTTTPDACEDILVTVNATDNTAVIGVEANGVTLIHQSGDIWSGTITAIAGTHIVNVSATDVADNVGWNNSTFYTATTLSASKININLHTGWNLISVPVNLTSWQLGNESIVGDPLNVTPKNSLTSIYRYNTTSGSFEKCDYFDNWGWSPSTGSENFTQLEPGRGYWVMANQDCVLTFDGTGPVDLDIILNENWNLVGWYSMSEALLGEETMIGDPLNVIPKNSLTSIYRYNATVGSFEKCDHFPDWGWGTATGSEGFISLEPGKGYWIMAENECVWKHEVL